MTSSSGTMGSASLPLKEGPKSNLWMGIGVKSSPKTPDRFKILFLFGKLSVVSSG